MPRSSKAPPLPPEPDINELIQNDVARLKRLLGLDVNRLAIGQEIEGIVTSSIFGSTDYTVTGANTIEFVNVTTTIVVGVQTAGSIVDTTPPSQVLGLNGTAASNTVINLTWTVNVESDLNHYNVYRGTTAGFTVTIGVTTPTATPSTNSYSDTGRTASTTYYYKVSAVDNTGNIGTLSTEKSVTTTAPDAIPPGQVLGLTATGTSDTVISLNWTANTEPDLASYNVYRGTTAGFTVILGTTTPTAVVFAPTHSYSDTGLTQSTTYYYKVSAVDGSGNIGALSSVAGGTTSAGPPAGTAPAPNDIALSLVNAGAAAGARHQLNFIWTSVTFTPAVTSYRQRFSSDSTFTNYFTATTGVPGAAFPAGGLLQSTTYYFQALSINSNGDGAWSASENITTPAPSGGTLAAPAGLTLSAGSPSSTVIGASWSAVSGATEYRVYYSRFSDFSTHSLITTASLSTNITGLTASTTYYVRILTTNANGQGPVSSSVSRATTA